MLSVDVLISTMDKGLERIFNFNHPQSPKVKYIIIHQTSSDYVLSPCLKQWLNIRNDIQYFVSNDKGLSKSRNLALSVSTSDLVVFCDDDVFFKEDAFETIRKVFNEDKNIDINTFKVKTPEGRPFKNYSERKFTHTWRTIFKVSSIEVVARRSSLHGLYFDTDFGLGTSLPASEENIFLLDCLNAGKKINFSPNYISVHPDESSGKNWGNQSMRSSKLSFFYRCFGFYSLPLFILFMLKKRTEYKTNISMYKMIKENAVSFIRYYKHEL